MKIEKYIAFFGIFLLLFVGFFHPIRAITQDLGRHLLLGEIILKNFSIPKTNLFSYTYPDFPFINLHWLSEVIFYLVFKLINFNGLLIFSTIIVIVAFLLIFLKALKNKNSPIVITIGSILYLRILFERTDIRPEIFSYLFLSIFIFILYKYRKKFTYWILILPFIELLWVNMHIYFIVGLAVLFLFLVENLIINKKDLLSTKTKVFFLVFTLSLFSTFLNPNYLKGAIYPFIFQQNYGYTIEENQNILLLWNYFQKQTIIYFVISATLLLLSFIVLLKKARLIDFFLSVLFIYLCVIAIRNFPLFVFGTFIAFTYNYTIIAKNIPKTIHKYIYYILLLVLILQIFQVSGSKGFGFGVDMGAEKAANFFIENNLKNPIFNNFDIGSYLDYRFYPKTKVFIDGRPGEYPAEFFKDVYIPMQYEESVFNRVDSKYKFNVIFFSYLDQTPWANSFLFKIVRNNNWKIIYIDDYVIILVKDNLENKDVIEKYKMDVNDLKFSNIDFDNKVSLIKLSVFLNKTGLKDQEIKIYENILKLDPFFCPALHNLASFYSTSNKKLSNIYLFKYQGNCK
ncbi:MAG: hypothetical protein V1697_00645 [Candidatus Levyibacteriota bacterium]